MQNNIIKKIHFIGVKGVGMSALAKIAKEIGYEVSGSDVLESFVTDDILSKAGIVVNEFNPNNLQNKPDLVVVSAAFDKDNVEVKEAKKKHLEIKTYSETLAIFSREHQLIAVAGIHGKTTTAAMIAYVLTKANLDPSFLIGAGNIQSLGSNAHYGKGEYFVVEADEYKKSSEDSISKFLDLNPQIEIITSIEMDHPDMFKMEEDVYNTFYKFACKIPRKGFIVLCTDYQKAKKIERNLADRNFETYGFEGTPKWKITEFVEDENETSFFLLNKEDKIGPFKMLVPGVGNVLNATATIITCLKLGLDEKLIKKHLFLFSGVKRRFEKIGHEGNITIIDDYAHHPRAVSLTLEALRKKFPKSKIWCIFQAHTYSRTKELLKDFALSFKNADKVFITDIYGSSREQEQIITGQDLADAIKVNHRSVRYIHDWDKIIEEIIDSASTETVVVTMGAGDIYKIADKILARLKND